jgi:energy-coupling factor transport system ATP-binding protein
MGYTAPDAERMIVMEAGRVVLDGPPSRLLTPITTETFGLTSGRDPDDFLPSVSGLHGFGGGAAEMVLAADRLSHTLEGRPILKGIDFRLRKGESVALLGANGAGKTTLLRHFNGLSRPTGGRVILDGTDIRNQSVSRIARRVGMAFQNPSSQFFKLSVKEEILAGPKALDCLDEGWIDRLVRLFRLAPLLDRPPFRLSGGEKKRVAFAAALAAKPDVLAMDEPTAGQDGHFRKALGGFLAELRNLGRSVIFATHDLAFAAQNAHRWVVMAEGKILAEGSPREMMTDHRLMARAGLRPPEGEGADV